MPKKDNLPKKKVPMKMKWGEHPKTEYKNALESIHVELVECTDPYLFRKMAPRIAYATWEDRPKASYTLEEQDKAVRDVFSGKVLPTASEMLQFVFLISNIDVIDVTHLIRHRSFSFSAHCTGDRDIRHDSCVVKSSIINNLEFYFRYMDIVNSAKKLYADMVDSKEVSFVDARTILPKSLVNHYYVRCNLKDFISFLKQRLDTQIQPESDNIIALKMLIEVAKRYPQIRLAINLDEPNWWYIKTSQEELSTNIYPPENKNDKFDWSPDWFIYDRKRSEMPGGHVFVEIWNKLREQYEELTYGYS